MVPLAESYLFHSLAEEVKALNHAFDAQVTVVRSAPATISYFHLHFVTGTGLLVLGFTGSARLAGEL